MTEVHISPSLTVEEMQLVSLQVDFGVKLNDCTGPSDLLQFIMERQRTTLYPEVVTALVLFLTILVTVASAERSFSKLPFS